MLESADGRLIERQVPALNALNERLRDRYIKDPMRGVARWNRVLQKHGVDAQIVLPHKAFNRRIGSLAGTHIGLDGRVIDAAEWNRREREWLPRADDRAYVASLMGRVAGPGQFAGWIAPPAVGINRQPLEFEYVRFG